ncbi:sensor histidine kinase [Mariniflexile litorale]|uniref:Sensor histidine kinase n=1 Tax=Mariniflexile litorale TaxID=3045158 RepID=A0AAU7EHS7_9FLAO|nr:sensor histidine kinase [Mariniflexile sp. KMM 9835]MDQ8210889.1 sensor histidine kinase [Mariniflexile sp. KMM 9835]
MKNENKLHQISWRYHVVFWMVYFLFNTFRWGSYFNDYEYSLKSNMLGFPIHMALSYLNIFILMPFLIYRKKYFLYILSVLSAIFIMVLVKFNLTYLLISQNVWPEGPEFLNKLSFNYTIDMMIGELYVITFVAAIKITLDFLKEHKRVTDLEKAQLETELLFLKNQISPHFFFNTLNNIYSLSVEKSEKTPKIILKLSELMRYMLYETKERRQTLENEILCIQNYIDLERVRYDDSLEVNMSISGDIQDKEIAPILLLTFIENAFKHGANKNIGKVKIVINFKIKENFLYFTVINPLPLITDHKDNLKQSSGIGLENVKKRLELGYNKKDYDLKIKSHKNKFVVKLKIKVG